MHPDASAFQIWQFSSQVVAGFSAIAEEQELNNSQ
jgi:hypothetical protein